MHPAQLLSDPRRPYVPQSTTTDPARTSDSFTSSPAHLPTSPSLSPFDPPAHLIPNIIRDLADPTLSLAMTAREHNTDLDSLCIWMAREEIAQRIFLFESACATKTRMAASSNMTMVAQTCHAIIHEFHDDQHHMGYKPQTPHGHEVKRRNRETAMRAGRLLFRLAHYVPMSPAAVARAAQGGPTLRGGTSPASPKSASHKSAIRNPQSEIAAALLDNPALATQLANAVAARLAQPNAPSQTPKSEIPNPQSEILPAPATPPEQSSEARTSGRNTLSPGRQPRVQGPPVPEPAERAKHSHPTTPKSVAVALTISAPSLLAAAAAPHARAP